MVTIFDTKLDFLKTICKEYCTEIGKDFAPTAKYTFFETLLAHFL